MFKGVNVVCFAACYLIALIVELLQLRSSRENKLFPILASVATFMGVVAHAVFLYNNDLLQNDHFFASASGWFSVLAFTFVLVEIYLTRVYPRTRFGLFLLPLALILTGVAFSVDKVIFTPTATCLWVRTIHACALLLTTLIAIFGALSGGMYFWQRRHLRQKLAEGLFSLPSLEWLSRATRFAANTTVIALGVGVFSGFYLKLFSGSGSRFDVASVATPILFVVALLPRLSKRHSGAKDVCAFNAVHNFVLAGTLLILLFIMAFGPQGHWKPAERQATEVEQYDKTPDVSEIPSLAE